MGRVLIAEDEAVARQLVRRIVEDLGHVAVVSGDGRHAYDTLLIDDSFDLLITDIMMPRMSGEDLVLAVRGHPEFDGMPIIMMSGVVGYAQIRHLLEVGVSLFVPKPIDRERLLEYLQQYLPAPTPSPQV